MKRKEKITILLLIIFTVILVIVGANIKKEKKEESTVATSGGDGSYVIQLDDETEYNTSESLNSTKKLGNLELYDIQLTYGDGLTKMAGTIKNNGDTEQEDMYVDIVFLDENDNEIATMGGIVNKTEAGGTSEFFATSTLNYIDAYNFRLEKQQGAE